MMMMNIHNESDSDAILKGQTQILRYIYGVLDGMALRCCVELRIADIISTHGRPTTLSEIANCINSPSINMDGLRRLMRFLVHKKVFDEMPQPEKRKEEGQKMFDEMRQPEKRNEEGEKAFNEMPRPEKRKEEGEKVFDEMPHPEKRKAEGEKAYSLNYCSKWLLHDTNVTLAPMVMMRTDPSIVLPLHVLSRSIKEGGTSFKMTHGEELFDFSLHNSEFNRIFNAGMACTAKITIDVIISEYKNGFLGLKGSVVDVGGGTGVAISEIVKTYPHLTGINFDLPHVISTAPSCDGVTHVPGDMFNAIPPTETIFMKWILHDWSDEDCIKILKNCRKVLPKETGKLIIVEIVQDSIGDDIFYDTRFTYDLVMFSHFSSGKERTESEWKKLLEEGGFCRYNIIKIPALQSIIEAFPE